MKKSVVSFAFLAFLCGCSSVSYYTWTGDPTVHHVNTGGLEVPNMPIPVYFGSVPKPANKIGVVVVTRTSRLVNAELVAASEAKRHGADALLEVSDNAEYAGTIGVGNAYMTQFATGARLTTGSAYSVPVYHRSLVALALQWSTNVPPPSARLSDDDSMKKILSTLPR